MPDGSTHTSYFFDMFLPFGLRSSPALFLKFIDSLRFAMAQRGITPLWNYLDDFWTCGPPVPNNSCSHNLDVMDGHALTWASPRTPRKRFFRQCLWFSLAFTLTLSHRRCASIQLVSRKLSTFLTVGLLNDDAPNANFNL